MKTLKELNSKWYWRFVKVIYFSLLFIVMASCILVYDEMKTYNPEIFKIYDEKQKDAYERLKELRLKYPNKIVSQEEMKNNHTPASDLSSLYRMGKEIEGQVVDDNRGEYNKEKCTAMFGNYIQALNHNGKVNDFLIDTGACGVYDEVEFNKIFEKLNIYFDKRTNIKKKAEAYQDITGEYIYRDYLDAWSIVKTIFAVIGLWITIGFLAFGIRSAVYYVIFGKIFPPK